MVAADVPTNLGMNVSTLPRFSVASAFLLTVRLAGVVMVEKAFQVHLALEAA